MTSTNKKRSKVHYNFWKMSSLCLLIVVICLFIILHKTQSSASTESPKEILYTSVEIQAGDSIWSIAKKYYTDDWKDIRDYIKEIKQFNGLTSDTIHEGNYIAVPYIQ